MALRQRLWLCPHTLAASSYCLEAWATCHLLPWGWEARTSSSGLRASGRCEAGSTCSSRPWKLLLSSAACAATASRGFTNWT